MEALQPLVKEYILPVLDSTSKWGLKDFSGTLIVSIVVVAIRAAADAVCHPICRRWLKGANPKLADDPEALKKTAEQVFDNIWIATSSYILVAYAWYVTLEHNGGCTPWSTKECFVKWPNSPYTQHQRYFLLG